MPASGEHHPAFEEYCECIFELDEDDVAVIQARIAERLQVSRPAVSEMIRRLDGEGLITTDGAIRLTKSGEASLVYATYLGGSGLDEVRKLALDSSGRLLIAGTTLSTDFPVTADAFQPAFGSHRRKESSGSTSRYRTSVSGRSALVCCRRHCRQTQRCSFWSFSKPRTASTPELAS